MPIRVTYGPNAGTLFQSAYFAGMAKSMAEQNERNARLRAEQQLAQQRMQAEAEMQRQQMAMRERESQQSMRLAQQKMQMEQARYDEQMQERLIEREETFKQQKHMAELQRASAYEREMMQQEGALTRQAEEQRFREEQEKTHQKRLTIQQEKKLLELDNIHTQIESAENLSPADKKAAHAMVDMEAAGVARSTSSLIAGLIGRKEKPRRLVRQPDGSVVEQEKGPGEVYDDDKGNRVQEVLDAKGNQVTKVLIKSDELERAKQAADLENKRTKQYQDLMKDAKEAAMSAEGVLDYEKQKTIAHQMWEDGRAAGIYKWDWPTKGSATPPPEVAPAPQGATPAAAATAQPSVRQATAESNAKFIMAYKGRNMRDAMHYATQGDLKSLNDALGPEWAAEFKNFLPTTVQMDEMPGHILVPALNRFLLSKKPPKIAPPTENIDAMMAQAARGI